MIGNNSSGTRSVVYGKTIDNLLECTVVLADGTVLHCQPETEHSWRQQEQTSTRQAGIYRGVREIIEKNQTEIAARFPRVMRRVGGYNLDAFLPIAERGQPGGWNLANLICGSEGTLGVLLEAKLRLQPLPAATSVCVIQFRDLIESLRAVDTILEFRPSAIELLDSIVMVEARRNPTTAHLTDFLEPDAAAILIVELCGDTPAEVRHRTQTMVAELRARDVGFAWPIRDDADGQKRVWDVRKIGLGLIANSPGVRKGQAFIEDACVPTRVLADYARQVYDICERYGVPLTTYAHASVGVLHFRPMLDLHNPQDIETMRSIANECFEIVKQYGGAWSGEHGDGLVRGEFVPKYFGPVIYQAFRDVKSLFDPQGLMNPGKVVDSPPLTENLRYGPNYRPSPPPTQFHYRNQGGFRLAVEQCAGIGACRKTGAGTMCPSYMATRDEEHTTRGRANALRLAMSGQLGEYALTSDRLHDVLKLCLSCKACKTECPTSVDMSRLKSEVLHWRHESRGASLADRLMGRAPISAAKLAGWIAPLANWGQSMLPVRLLLEKFAHIDRRRPLPKLARQPLARQLAPSTTRRADGAADSRLGPVALFVDTFTNYYEPHVGQAAIALLEGCGYDVQPAIVGCCQRPQISRGLLDEAKQHGLATLHKLHVLATAGLPILVLEPSCASALVDDLPDLIDEQALGKEVAGQVRMLDVFLAQEMRSERLAVDFRCSAPELLIHGHCHQKAMFGTQAMKDILATIEGLKFSEVDSGCCGMAGSFGYEHYDLSRTIGEDRLFPAVRNREAGTEVIACGISCRHQLHDFLGVTARHWVEVLSAHKREGQQHR